MSDDRCHVHPHHPYHFRACLRCRRSGPEASQADLTEINGGLRREACPSCGYPVVVLSCAGGPEDQNDQRVFRDGELSGAWAALDRINELIERERAQYRKDDPGRADAVDVFCQRLGRHLGNAKDLLPRDW